MLLFHNKEKDTYFAVDNIAGKAIFISKSTVNALKKIKSIVGGLDTLVLPNYDIVKKFQREIKKGILKEVPLEKTKEIILDKYPEFFI